MVCVADEPRVQCIVRDIVLSSDQIRMYEVTLPASTPVHELINCVATNMNYEPNSFQLTLQSRGPEKTLTTSTLGSLEDLGFCTEPGSRNSLLLQGLENNSSKLAMKLPPGNDVQVKTVSGPSYPSSPPPPLLPPASSPAGDYSYSAPIIRHDTVYFMFIFVPGYVGLVNQAMTCYLNSLLQALFMTPEFRNALYKWKFDSTHGVNAAKCIPFQLQKLFLNLQTSTKTAVETTELTRSFGWESGEVWQQHDIQELCRVMFDALEQEFKETEQADLINQLYQGKMTDYVKCLECGREKSREDTFLDIPLPVRPFGSAVAYGSIEEALRAFVQPETLEGNNQYFCESCNKKCDAHKGLKFSKFPYLLTLHLKRFDFDYNTMHRIKLNDKVVFPEELDLNSFVGCVNNVAKEDVYETVEIPVKSDDSSTADSALDEETCQPSENNLVVNDQDEDEGIDISSSSGNNADYDKIKFLQKGPFIYELYSIMIHSGSASGGHYYAYIKDFAKGEWFCFNDQSVTRITKDDIVKTYGGGPARGYYSGAYSSSTNAYMLMYRQIEGDRNASAIKEDQFPLHIVKLLQEIRDSEENERAMRLRQEEMIKLKVYTNPPVPEVLSQTKLYCYSDTTLTDALHLAYQNLLLEGVVPEEQCRLVSFNRSQDQMEVSFEGREKETIGEIISSLRNSSNYEMFLEIREKDQVFTPYSLGDICMTVFRVDAENEEVISVHNLRTSPCQFLSDLKEFFCTTIPLQSPDIHVILAKPTELVVLTNESTPLNRLGFYSCNRVSYIFLNQLFICSKDERLESLMAFVEKIQNVITLHITLPNTTQDALEGLFIPPLSGIKVNGNNKRATGATQTGRNYPLSNGLEEESTGGGGAGGTSDQSTSEDSSLTDSERTIIGEVQNECQLSSPSDSDQQLSSPETNLPSKFNEMNGETEENWDEETDENKTYFFKCHVYTTEDSQKVLRVIVDRQIDMNTLKNKLEEYVGVESKYFKLYRGPYTEVTNSFNGYKDEEKLLIKLHRYLNEGEYRVKVYCLQINSTNPLEFMFVWIVNKSESVESTKKAILRELEKRHDVKIPLERLEFEQYLADLII
ncbi:hypothetical protein AAG570_012119 [Ranatra chinensis]|uniref:Ubiquitin carboxyl-terminal hydrolase 47 n=1 Tax=Ranatra chinensis TaxID=642074 RepID=A0ABD0YHV4_9HEMI